MTPPPTRTDAPPVASDPPAGSPAARRRAARALGDAALVAALATLDPAVWAEFDARFRPVLEVFARRMRVPEAFWTRCVDDVLADEAMRWSEGAPAPERVGPYLITAARHALFKARRAATRRTLRYGAAAHVDGASNGALVAGTAGESVVATVCSAAALRASRGDRNGAPAGWEPVDDADVGRRVLTAAAGTLLARLTDTERQMLAWVAEQVPRRQIAAWVGENYEATRKRIQRLTHRVQLEARQYAATLPSAERHEFERFLRRAGHPVAGAVSTSRRASPPAEVAP